MIYTNFVDLHSLMLHAKFQNQRPSGSEEDVLRFLLFTLYSHGGHLGHVTMTIYANFHSIFLRTLHIKFGFDWPSGFRQEDARIFWSYTCIYNPGAGTDKRLCLKYNHNHLNDIFLCSPIQMRGLPKLTLP